VITHVTFQIPREAYESPELDEFMNVLGLEEIPTTYQDAWDCRWFMDVETTMEVHLTAAPMGVEQGLGHLCVVVNDQMYRQLGESKWVERKRPGGWRTWLLGPGGLRVEIQSAMQSSYVG
jgi:hypothetical protein